MSTVTEVSTAQRVRYFQLDGAIHEIVFLEANRSAIDDYVALMDQLYAGWDGQSTTLRLLIDGSTHWIQFRGQMDYLIYCIQKLFARYPKRPSTRIAFLLRDRHRTQVLDASLRLLHLKADQVRYFSITQPRDAIRWLRQLE